MTNFLKLNQPISRKKYWTDQIYLIFLGFILELISRILFNASSLQLPFFSWGDTLGVNIIKIVFIFLAIVNIMLQAQRLLDIGLPKSISLLTLLALIGTGFISLIGSIPTLICLFFRSKNMQ